MDKQQLLIAGIGFLGVIIGVISAAITQFIVANRMQQIQLRLAALDRRLIAHQEAFTLWRDILSNVHDVEANKVTVAECQVWWNHNCLYLDPSARRAFQIAYISASNHPSLLSVPGGSEVVKRNWEDIERAGKEIVKGASLPSLGENESKIVGKNE